jgi:signal transduction histidine kinase
MADDPLAPPRENRTSLALLAVEDSAEDAELIARELVENGLDVQVRRVQTREEMARALRGGRWDAISMDYQLPAFGALEALKLRGELAPDVPVIIVSGYIGETAAVELLKAGAEDYIPKHNLARLAPALRRAIRDGEERRARRKAEEDRARLVSQLASALELRDDFLVLASHELRTPLTALRFQVEGALRIRGGSDVIRHRLAQADLQLDRIERLIEDMLTVSNLRPPEPLRRQETDARLLMSNLMTSFAAAKVEGLSLDVPPEPVMAWVDPRQLEDALRRIVENAVKYGAGKPIDLRLGRAGRSMLVSVTDRGIGIAPEQHERIFERFGRAGSTSNYGGLGLGLWIARQIVEAHGGALSVASQLDEGTTFTVSIPVAPPPWGPPSRSEPDSVS